MTVAYASPFGRNPEATYRQIEVAGQTAEADGPALVQLLYDQAIRALRGAAWAAENNNYKMKSDKVTRATAILFALEAGLDFDNGGTVAPALARLYAGTRMTVVNAAVHNDPTPFRDVADTLDEIGQAWRTVRAA
ncbi:MULTISPECIES: flagellar export chaperone FliS [unclassified Sphingomonas]|uniref:flagellar export chaperone FliS n=1 Tax=unclassified Sphingomonas TaxID=196159 RepID=UPI000287D1EF|nr:MULTISPECIES: flagellar export chaperone FliS [unclassified Sphingomonas]